MDPHLKSLILENPVFRSYLFYSSILALKMMLMTLLTIRQRLLNNALVSQEDAAFLGGTVCWTNEKVERVRRGHRNDMESIYLFLLVAFAYIWTDPEPVWADYLFLTFTIARILHTVVYNVIVVPQPARGLAWLVGYLITGYMAIKTYTAFK
ncbi:microsomal glutathione S-transferase 1 [Tribolium castaneum]|uniref:Microsomal glutathione S-transferase 1 n=1 Tax=Tribolium castaneum TaxID=7070 RepID=D6WU55_TRICA|nr:PREDICTED: microsomal glutathione S-transferase 1 [Tribolium castaneum]EFA06266.2 Microsomal glutathione S-transferase 1-like Protein [Tribolium castaneum]|eukprot:XP_968687.1 PREDICTED: microsomal glutathione S-transferase 1 [Tribolium castaneum]